MADESAMGMKSRAALWTALTVVVVLLAVFAAGSFRESGDRPGQPAPHALDQSQ